MAAAAAVTAAEFALLDGGTARGTSALASGDGFLHNDGGTMKMTSINKLADFQAAFPEPGQEHQELVVGAAINTM